MQMFPTLLFFLAVSATSLTSAQTPVQVDIYYESLCPDSIAFITKQFYPTYKKMAKYIRVNFVPFGNSNMTKDEITGIYSFVCQHGPAECHGNKVQACALGHIDDNMKKVEFIKCMMESFNISNADVQCATDAQVDHKPIEECFTKAEGNATLVKMGEKTKALVPPLKSVPTIVFDMKYNLEEQKMITKDFMSALCSHITSNKPTECVGKSGAALASYAPHSILFAFAALLPAALAH